MDLGLRGRIALITGGSRGIGKATALLLAGEGVRLAIAARGVQTLAEAAGEIRAAGGEVVTIQADFTLASDAARAVAETLAAYGGLDILVANAGGSFGERELATSADEDWEKTFRFNVGHAVAALRAATPALSRSEIGNAVFVASISGRAPAARGAQYAAAKAGLIHAARSLAWELGPLGIRVNAVSPGSTIFPGGGWEKTRAERPEDFARFEAEDFPAKRLGAVHEIADAIGFVVSPRAAGINAADIHVDGGQRRPSSR
jgi:3-oxoacyl-[acyl-carrier protein] reductase